MASSRGQLAHRKPATEFKDFLSTLNLNEGYAVSNRFEVLIMPPAWMAGAPVDINELSLRC